MKNLDTIKQSAKKSANLFILISVVFALFIVVFTVFSLIDVPMPNMPETEDSLLKINFLRSISAIIGFVSLEICLIIIIKALLRISKDGKPFAESNLKTFKLAENILCMGGLIGNFSFAIVSDQLPAFVDVNMQGFNMAICVCAVISSLFIDFLRHAASVQEELDEIA